MLKLGVSYVSKGGGGAWMGARRKARSLTTAGAVRFAGWRRGLGTAMPAAGGTSHRQSKTIHVQTNHMLASIRQQAATG